MKNILYISYFNDKNHYDILGLYHQILSNEDSSDLLSLFANDKLYYTYASKFTNKNNIHIKLFEDIDIDLFDIVKNYNNQYKYFIFLIETKLLINKNIYELLNNKNISTPKTINNNNKTIVSIFNFNDIIQKKQEQFLYRDLIHQPVISDETSKIFDKYFHLCQNDDCVLDETHNQTYYEDNSCLFAIFENKDFCGLITSPAYMNKNNNKIYNVHNNCVGDVINYQADKLTIIINWHINNNTYTCEYKKTGQIFI